MTVRELIESSPLDVRAILDDQTSFISASNSGDLQSDDEVEWDDIEIDEDAQRTIILRVRVKNTVDDGDVLRLTVEAGDDEDSETTRIED